MNKSNVKHMSHMLYGLSDVKDRIGGLTSSQLDLLRLLEQSPYLCAYSMSADLPRRLARLNIAQIEKLTRRRFLIGAGGLIGAAALGACGAGDEAVAPTVTTNGTRIFSHPLGETEVPVSPQRVVVLQDQNILAPLLEMGANNIVGSVGRLDDAGNPIFRRTEGYDVSGITHVGGWGPNANLEQIAAVQPDLIIGTQYEVNPESYDTLTQIAPTVLVPMVFRPVTESLADLAALTGFEERYNELHQAYLDHLAEVQQTLGDPSAILLSSIAFLEDSFILFYTNLLRQVIADIGFTLLPSHRRMYEPRETFDVSALPNFSFEVLPEHDGDVLIWPVLGEQPERDNPDVGDLWGQLNAVQKDQAFSFDRGGVIGGTTFRGLHAALDFFTESLTTRPLDTTWSQEQGLT